MDFTDFTNLMDLTDLIDLMDFMDFMDNRIFMGVLWKKTPIAARIPIIAG